MSMATRLEKNAVVVSVLRKELTAEVAPFAVGKVEARNDGEEKNADTTADNRNRHDFRLSELLLLLQFVHVGRFCYKHRFDWRRFENWS